MGTVAFPLRLPKKLLQEIDQLVKAGLYESRSEALRDAVRRLIETKRLLLEPYGYYRLQAEEAVLSSKIPLASPEEVIERVRKIREELWRKEREYFEP